MERKGRIVWWGILILLILVAFWKLFLPHGSNAYINKTSSTREIVVYVAGAVERPGLIRLPLDARLNDALKQANPLSEANIELLNPAEKLKDGQKITIPYKAVVPDLSQLNATSSAANGVIGSAPNAVSGAGVPSAMISSEKDVKININKAGISELDKLPGIGTALAERIIQYRNEHGVFSKPEDLKKVSGIAEKTYEKMAPMVTVGP